MNAGAAAAAAHAAMVQATKASGVIVRVDEAAFLTLVDMNPEPVVVSAPHNIFLGKKRIRYMTSYRGLAFVTESKGELIISDHADRVMAQKIWLPS